MPKEIAVALITSGLGLIGVIVTVMFGNKKTKQTVEQQTNLTIYRIEELEKKQDKHNTLIERMYKCEEDITLLKEQYKVEKHRIKDLEEFHKPHK